MTIPDGSASTTITVSPVDDGDAEGDETVICVILSGAGYDVGAPSSATVTVGDNEGFVVTITASDPSAAEPVNPGVFTVSRTGGTSGDLSVNYNVGGTATSGTDYASIGTSVTIPGGQASATITVTPIDNTLVEGTETVVVTLALGAGYSVGAPSSDAVTILDDDDFVVTITASDPNAAENPLGTGSFAVSRTGGTLGNLSVNYNVGGTAAPGTDYVSIGASVTIPAGQVAATITVTPNDDAFVEGPETVVVTLAAGAYTIGGASSDTVSCGGPGLSLRKNISGTNTANSPASA